MASRTEVVNMALGHLATGKEISDYESDASEEAQAARRFWDIALENVCRSAPWPFLTVIEALALIESEPNTEWAYSYQYPVMCRRFGRILSGIRLDTRQTRVPYRIAWQAGSRILFCDEEDAVAEYTRKLDYSELAQASPDFIFALSLYLAALIAPLVTRGDEFKLGERAGGMYTNAIAEAKDNAMNEQQDEELPEAESIRARE